MTATDAATGDLRPGRLVRATPTAVWLLVVLHGLLGLAYALAVPLLHAPDEPAHVDLVAQVDDHVELAPYEDLRYSPDVEEAVTRVGLDQIDWRFAPRSPWSPLDPSETVARSERPTYADLAAPGTAEIRNPSRLHPPAYYATVDGIDTVAQWLGAEPVATAPWDAVVLRWRVWSVLLTLPLPWLAFWTALRVSGRRRVGVAAATLVLAVPQLSQSAGSVNNDTLLFTCAGVVTLSCAFVATGDRSWRPAVIGGLGAGLAMLTKIFGLGAPVWLLGAYVVAVVAGHLRWPTAVGRLGAAAVATVVAGGWWPTRLFLATGTPSPRGFAYPVPDEVAAPLGPWLGEVVRRLTFTSWGWFGVEQFRLPLWLVVLATGAALAAIGVGLARRRGVAVVLLLPLATALVMVLYAAWDGYAQSGIPSGLHGRYLFTGLVGATAVAATGIGAAVPGRRPVLAVPVGMVLLMQAVGLWVVVSSYWAGPGLSHVRSLVAFSPWSGRVLAPLAAAAAATAVLTGIGLVREAGRDAAPTQT